MFMSKIFIAIFIYIIVIFAIMFSILFRLHVVEQELDEIQQTILNTKQIQLPVASKQSSPQKSVEIIEINEPVISVDAQYEQYQRLLNHSSPREREWIQENERKFKEKLEKKQELDNRWLETHFK
jgi:biopolymer transport protein ExbB/TolQ